MEQRGGLGVGKKTSASRLKHEMRRVLNIIIVPIRVCYLFLYWPCPIIKPPRVLYRKRNKKKCETLFFFFIIIIVKYYCVY